MKLSVLSFLLVIILACNDKKANVNNKTKSIDGEQLVLIIRDSSFIRLKELINYTDYQIIDSNETYDGKILYSAQESSAEQANVLSATMTKNLAIYYLHFTTYSEKLVKKLKQQFIELGFKSLGDTYNVEDFENNNVYISTVETKKHYSVVLIRRD